MKEEEEEEEEEVEEVEEIMEDSFLSHWSTKVRKGDSRCAAKSESDRSEDSVETFAQCSPSKLIMFWRSASRPTKRIIMRGKKLRRKERRRCRRRTIWRIERVGERRRSQVGAGAIRASRWVNSAPVTEKKYPRDFRES